MGGERNGIHFLGVPFEDPDRLPRRRVPEPDRVVTTRRGDGSAIRRERTGAILLQAQYLLAGLDRADSQRANRDRFLFFNR